MDRFLVTLGDPQGIGPEILKKALNKINSRGKTIVIIGNREYIEANPINSINEAAEGINLVNIDEPKAGLAYVETAIEILKNDPTWALITLPVSKERINRYGPGFKGHTDLFRRHFTSDLLMCFIYEDVRTTLLTEHIPLKDVAGSITPGLIESKIELAERLLKKHFDINRAHIAVSGLNPHCGDSGALGNEEELIRQTIDNLNNSGHNVSGPFSVEYLTRRLKDYDFTFYCYHDQIVPVMKALYPACMNVTLGLPFWRFSPSHGTAFDIAGQDKADSSSLEYILKYSSSLSH